MNNEVILRAINNVDAIGYISPKSDPPDILGVLFNQVCADATNDQQRIDLLRQRAELTPQCITQLLHVSEMYGNKETPEQRRDRLLDHFAALVEKDQHSSLKLPPEDANMELMTQHTVPYDRE